MLNLQALEVYDSLISLCNIKSYKSNAKVFGSDYSWRSAATLKENNDKFFLLHRIILSGGYITYDSVAVGHLGRILNDIMIIANQLNFHCFFAELSGMIQNITFSTNYNIKFRRKTINSDFFTGPAEVLFSFKVFKNGNLHMKFNSEFMAKLNTLKGKLEGWITNPKQASEEIEGVSIKDATEVFDTSYRIESSSILGLSFDNAS